MTIAHFLASSVLVLACALSAEAEYLPLDDTRQDSGAAYRQRLMSQGPLELEIRRIVVDGPYYDGPDGYTAVTVRAFEPPLRTVREISTQLLRGQFRLAGIQTDTWTVVALRLKQHGAGVLISDVVLIPPDSPGFSELLPPQSGPFQYASISPNGAACLLFGLQGIALNVRTGCTAPVPLPFELSPTAADPPTTGDLGGGWSLSGKFLKVTWTSQTSATLVLSDPKTGHAQRVELSLPRECFAVE